MITPRRAALENRERQRIFLCQRPKVPLYIVPLSLLLLLPPSASRIAFRTGIPSPINVKSDCYSCRIRVGPGVHDSCSLYTRCEVQLLMYLHIYVKRRVHAWIRNMFISKD